MNIKTYNDIITRISQLVDISKDSKNNKRICYFDIDSDHLNEFDSLIKTELVWHELQNNLEKHINSNILLKFEAKKIANENNQEIVDKLIEIIDSTSGLQPFDLEVVDDYVIRRNDSQMFHLYTKQLHIGPYVPLSIGVEKDKNKLKHLIERSKEQFNRINEHIGNSLEFPTSNEPFIKSKYSTYILLANNGLLDKKAMEFISTQFNPNEYKELLTDLRDFKAITEEEYNDYFALKPGKSIYINTIDQLVDYFKNVKDISIEGLESFKNYLGSYELEKLIFELFKEGIFSTEEYIEQYLNIKENLFKK